MFKDEANGEEKSEDASTTTTAKLRKKLAGWTSTLERTNPYNPRWAQLGDLHGAVNHPMRLVRTVLVGENRELVERLLLLASYFIRCSNASFYDVSHEQLTTSDIEAMLASASASQTEQPASSDKQQQQQQPRDVSIVELGYDALGQLSSAVSNGGSGNGGNSGMGGGVSSVNSLVCSPTTSTRTNFTATSSSSAISSTSSTTSADGRHPPLQPPPPPTTTTTTSAATACQAFELPLIGSRVKANSTRSSRMQDNYGYSLLASYCDSFVFEFVLHGTSDRSFMGDLRQRLRFSKHNSILGSAIHEAVYIVVDVDNMETRVFSSEDEPPTPVITSTATDNATTTTAASAAADEVEQPSPLVDELLASVANMCQLFPNSEFVLLHVEDQLHELCNKAMALDQLRAATSQHTHLDDTTLMSLIGYVSTTQTFENSQFYSPS